MNTKPKSFTHKKSSSTIFKEIWYLFDTFVYCRLNDFIETGDTSCDKLDDLIRNLSTSNINTHPLTFFEAAKSNPINFLPLNRNEAIKYIETILKSQCVDLNYSLTERVFSNNRIDFILNEFEFKADSIENLSEQLYVSFEPMFTTIVANKLKEFKEGFVRPIISKCYDSNKLSCDRLTKIDAFLDSLDDLPYCPKIVDFCLHLLLKSDSEPLLKGFFKKMKTELENTLNDIAICEMSTIANFLNPFKNIRPHITFFTTDKNLHYYSKLGKPLILIQPDNTFQRLYYPDLNSLNITKKEKAIIKKYFRGHNKDEFVEILTQTYNFSEKDLSTIKWDRIAYFEYQG